MLVPLNGIRVLDLSQSMAGPFCSMMLGDMGADVVKIETPPSGDVSRSWIPPAFGGESAYFLSVNRNKRSVMMNLKTLEGREILAKLAKRADVLIESFRPGVAKRLGFAYEDVRDYNPRIIYCSISGYGQSGPSAAETAFDLCIQARSGIMGITGEKNRPPVKVGIPITDISAGMYAAFSIVLSLYTRAISDRGDYIDISLLDSAVSMLTFWVVAYSATRTVPERLGSAHPMVSPYQLYRTKDSFVAIGASNDDFWRKTCAVFNAKNLVEDERFATNENRVANREILEAKIEEFTTTRTTAEWLQLLNAVGVPVAQLNSLEDVINDPQIHFREMLRRIRHQTAGEILVTDSPIRMRDNTRVFSPPPLLGEHTKEVLKEIGYRDEDIETFRKRGVFDRELSKISKQDL